LIKFLTTKIMKIKIAMMLGVLIPLCAAARTPKNKFTHSGHNNPVTAPNEMTRNIEFDFAKADVGEEYDQQLNDLAKAMIAKPYLVSLRGHADAIGSYVANWKTSEKRAIAVKAYLVKKGIKEDRIVTTPFGSAIPLATNKTKAGRHKNRRVEIKLALGDSQSSVGQ
jgi:outer membrane protein OmpA-like peptidoglycan-associated protein